MSRTSRPHTEFVGLAIAGCWLFAACSLASAACVGDCDDNGVTSIAELQTCINVYLGTQAVGTCSNCDRDHSGDESISELQDSATSFLSDATSCPTVSVCGNAVIEPGEQCESDTDCAQGETCDASCQCTAGGTGLGTRIFSLAGTPSSKLFNSVVPGVDVSLNPYVGQLEIVAGPQDGNGVASLSLASDAILGAKIINTSVVCIKVLAAGASGSIDCDGGSPHDASMFQDSHGSGAADPPVVQLGLGTDAGPGAASLTAQVSAVNLPVGSDPVADCPTATFTTFVETPITTASLTATIFDPVPGSVGASGGQIVMTQTGAAFSCANWTVEDSEGVLLIPFLDFDNPDAGGDVVAILMAADS